MKEGLDLDMEKAHSGDGETETIKEVAGSGLRGAGSLSATLKGQGCFKKLKSVLAPGPQSLSSTGYLQRFRDTCGFAQSLCPRAHRPILAFKTTLKSRFF